MTGTVSSVHFEWTKSSRSFAVALGWSQHFPCKVQLSLTFFVQELCKTLNGHLMQLGIILIADSMRSDELSNLYALVAKEH
jgi:hypothetical protein